MKRFLPHVAVLALMLSLAVATQEVLAQPSPLGWSCTYAGPGSCAAVAPTACWIFGACTVCDTGCPSSTPPTRKCTFVGGTVATCFTYGAPCPAFSTVSDPCTALCQCPNAGAMASCSSGTSLPYCL